MAAITILGITVLLTAPAAAIAFSALQMWRNKQLDQVITMLLRAGLATFITTGSAAVLATALFYIAQISGNHKFVGFIAPAIPILSAWGFIGLVSIFTGVTLKIDKWKV